MLQAFHRLLVAQRTPWSRTLGCQICKLVRCKTYRPIARERGLSPPPYNTFQLQLHERACADTGLLSIGSGYVPSVLNAIGEQRVQCVGVA
jgi:hypothetical protein